MPCSCHLDRCLAAQLVASEALGPALTAWFTSWPSLRAKEAPGELIPPHQTVRVFARLRWQAALGLIKEAREACTSMAPWPISPHLDWEGQPAGRELLECRHQRLRPERRVATCLGTDGKHVPPSQVGHGLGRTRPVQPA